MSGIQSLATAGIVRQCLCCACPHCAIELIPAPSAHADDASSFMDDKMQSWSARYFFKPAPSMGTRDPGPS